jgi:hypothetical protein
MSAGVFGSLELSELKLNRSDMQNRKQLYQSDGHFTGTLAEALTVGGLVS